MIISIQYLIKNDKEKRSQLCKCSWEHFLFCTLTPVQKLDIILNMEELLGALVEEGKKAKVDGGRKGAEITNKNGIVSADTNPKPSHDTINEIAEMSGMSRATVGLFYFELK